MYFIDGVGMLFGTQLTIARADGRIIEANATWLYMTELIMQMHHLHARHKELY